MNPADNIPIPDAFELAEYREELLLSDGWARCEACGEVVASLTPVTDCGETLGCCAGCDEDPTVTEPQHHACCGSRIKGAEITGTETHVCQVAGVYATKGGE